MADEERFVSILGRSRLFKNVCCKTQILLQGYMRYVEVDCIAQKRRTLFVFEGSSASPDERVIDQLKLRYQSLQSFKLSSVPGSGFEDYDYTRLFYYSFKRKVIIEYDKNGDMLQNFNFSDDAKLVTILQNL